MNRVGPILPLYTWKVAMVHFWKLLTLDPTVGKSFMMDTKLSLKNALSPTKEK
jgi:hypothetical protein